MFGLDRTFKALADPTRRAILSALRGGARTAGDLAERVHAAPSALSFHLRILKDADLVFDRREGQFIRYSLNTSVVQDAINVLLTHFGDGRGAAQRGPTPGGSEGEEQDAQ